MQPGMSVAELMVLSFDEPVDSSADTCYERIPAFLIGHAKVLRWLG